MIKLRGVEKSYRTRAGETFVLRRIDADIREGEFVTITGPSGAGKSTLLSILGMLDGDWRGEYELFGEALTLVGVAACASWLPARRAAGVDPVQALRAE